MAIPRISALKISSLAAYVLESPRDFDKPRFVADEFDDFLQQLNANDLKLTEIELSNVLSLYFPFIFECFELIQLYRMISQ
jgi:hypothetical protein